mmetsp:Transcript_26051/g.104241  ORF Transcript_26051/g.104241 Transcript_26051/m.104241 type:complete len:230 (+) Transcript_26051:290-979(+)
MSPRIERSCARSDARCVGGRRSGLGLLLGAGGSATNVASSAPSEPASSSWSSPPSSSSSRIMALSVSRMSTEGAYLPRSSCEKMLRTFLWISTSSVNVATRACHAVTSSQTRTTPPSRGTTLVARTASRSAAPSRRRAATCARGSVASWSTSGAVRSAWSPPLRRSRSSSSATSTSGSTERSGAPTSAARSRSKSVSAARVASPMTPVSGSTTSAATPTACAVVGGVSC